jgi:hypothetical protein
MILLEFKNKLVIGVVVLPIVFDCMIFSLLLFSKRKSRAKSLIIEWLLPLCNQGSF